jgi:hypothetical protein
VQVREILAKYLKKAIKPVEDEEGKEVQLHLPLSKARADLPEAALTRLLAEYRLSCGETTIDYEGLSFAPHFLEGILERIKQEKKINLKDTRTHVTFFPETSTARVVIECQGFGFSEVTVRSANELWTLLKKAATDGIDIPAPPPTPYRIETADEWLKTHRAIKVGPKAHSEGQATPKKKRYSPDVEEMLKIELKL